MNLILGQNLDPAFILTDYQSLKDQNWFFPFGITVNDEIIYFMQKYYGFEIIDREQAKTWGEVILPIYQELILSDDFKPFQAKGGTIAETFPAPPALLRNTIVDNTGIDKQFVWNYLSALESLAKSGEIDYKHYDPRKKELEIKTEESIFKDLPSPGKVYTDLTQLSKKYSNTISIIAICGAGAVAIYYGSKIFKH